MLSRHRSFRSALLGAATLLAAPLAFAQSSEPGKPCKADLEKICPGVEPGHGRILACLEGKTDQLSPACKDDVSKKLNAFYKACKPDADKLCATVEQGGGRVMQCLKDNEASLSKSCKKVWEKTAGKKKAAAK
ncbi:MAG TPA: cysteine rich repeat-containing protein [Myxococcaceae bacterium]|nr:cysteine rich repeat-containing protein [Myxococcaceae bacterium]